MLNKVISKIIFVIIITLCIFSLMIPKTYAIGDVISDADGFLDKSDGQIGLSSEPISDLSDLLYNILLVIGIVVAVIVGIVIGIKFLTGSVEEKAKVKETLVPYVAGCIVLFGAFTIWKIVVTIVQSA